MSLPLLEYKPTTQNQRVPGFGSVDTNGDISFVYSLQDATTPSGVDELIQAAYRQVFNEQEMLQFNRQVALETQVKNRSITVRDFIRGLAKSERFYRLVVEPNNNYRLVEVCLKRLLGRPPYNKDEEIAWSVQIGTRGWGGFVDALIDSEEYTQNFGDNIVPYQRKRMSDRPFSFTPRYGAYYRDRQPQPRPYYPQGRFQPLFEQFEPFSWEKLQQRADGGVLSGVLILSLGVVLLGLAIAGWSIGGAV